MPKLSTQFTCQTCGNSQPKWSGKCEACGAWNSLVESSVNIMPGRPRSKAKSFQPEQLGRVDSEKRQRFASGIADFDQVIGGGIVPGAVMLLSGDPGIGKSTLVLQLAAQVAQKQPVLYVSGEESTSQIKLRADRLGLGSSQLDLLAETDIDGILATLDGGDYGLVIFDSIQTMATAMQASSPGTVGQITASAQLLQNAAKRSSTAILIIGHVTKEGAIAGPKILEHLVDVVLYLEGEKYGNFKSLRGIKNRFGSTNEVGIFEMTDQGLATVANPSEALLAERQAGSGSVVLATLEGTRPILVEVQALVATTVFGYPKRTAAGVDLNRLNLLAAVLSKRAGLNLSNQDIFVNIVGGLKILEPAADLAIILSIVSAFKNKALKKNLVVFGEVGLNGEVRSVSNADKRLAEAKKLGFSQAVGPSYNAKRNGILGVSNIQQAIEAALES